MQKGNYVRYSDRDIERADSVDLVSFLQNRGEELKRAGSEYFWIYRDGSGKHDSVAISGNKWFDHKNQTGGGAIKFVREHLGLNFPDAVGALIGGHYEGAAHEFNSNYFPKTAVSEKKKEFEAPAPFKNMHRTFAYLTQTRFIDGEVLAHFAREKKIYEQRKEFKTGEGKVSAFHNAVFAGYDENGIMRQASTRSTLTFGKSFRQTVEGSDTKYSFSHDGAGGKLYVFEAPIDMLSFISMNKENWKEQSYLAMNGVYENAVLHKLETNPNISEIILCTDNDEGGIDANDRLTDILRLKGYTSVFRLTSEMKDWNECLKARRGVTASPAERHLRKDIYTAAALNLRRFSFDGAHLTAALRSYLNSGEYIKFAETALSASARFSSIVNGKSEDECFSVLKETISDKYKPYLDKSKLPAKTDKLHRVLRDVAEELQKASPNSPEYLRNTARLLYKASAAALSCAAEVQLEQPAQELAQGGQEAAETPEAREEFGMSMAWA